MAYQQQQAQIYPQHGIASSVSVQNLASANGQTPPFQHSVSLDEPMTAPPGGFPTKKINENLKQIVESNSNRGSQASTPQGEVVYDVHLHSLHHKLQMQMPPLPRPQTTAPPSPQSALSSLEFPQDVPPLNPATVRVKLIFMY